MQITVGKLRSIITETMLSEIPIPAPSGPGVHAVWAKMADKIGDIAFDVLERHKDEIYARLTSSVVNADVEHPEDEEDDRYIADFVAMKALKNTHARQALTDVVINVFERIRKESENT
jgi:hypothetical protein